ncbi:MAG: DMT family transporter [Acidobacteriota bacterium]|jgi:drug/metabolite transporter (DMT)-like permease
MNHPDDPAPTHVLRVIAALTVVQFLFATHYVAAKEVLAVVPPRLWAAVRVLGAAMLLLAVTRLQGYRLPRGGRTLLRFTGFALLGVVINQVCFVEGLARTTPVSSALINCSIPVLTYLFAVVLRHEPARAWRALGIAVALGGIAVLLRLESFDLRDTLVQGNVLTVVNATSFSLFLVVSRPDLRRIPTLPATALLFLLGSAPITLLALPELAAFHPSVVPARIWWLGAYIVLFPTVGAYLLNYWSLRRAASSLVALFIYLQPVLAAVLAWLVRSEAPSSRDVLAFLLVAAGIAFVARDSRRRGEPAA